MAVGDIVRSGEGRLLEKDPKVARAVVEGHLITTHRFTHNQPTLRSSVSCLAGCGSLWLSAALLSCTPQAFWRGPDARDNDPLHDKKKDSKPVIKKRPKIDYDAPLERVGLE